MLSFVLWMIFVGFVLYLYPDFPDDEMLTDTQVDKLNNTFAQMEEDANANMMQSFSPAPITDMTDDAKAQETHAELSNDTNGSH